MLNLGRSMVPGQLAEALEEEVRKGTWKGSLPGYRILSRQYGVSRMTCDAAFVILERRGVLAPAEPRKPRRIVANTGTGIDTRRVDKEVETLLLVIDKYQQDATCPILIAIREFWLQQFGDVRVVKEDLVRFKDPHERLMRWVERENADCLLLYVVPLVWADSAIDSGLPTHMLGGTRSNKGELSGSGYDLGNDMKVILERLSGMGHRRILSPTHMSRARLRKAMVGAYVEVFGGVESEYEGLVPVFHEADPKCGKAIGRRSFFRNDRQRWSWRTPRHCNRCMVTVSSTG